MLVSVTLGGSVQTVSAKLALGTPVAVNENVLAWPGMKVALFALVIVGGNLTSMVTVAKVESS